MENKIRELIDQATILYGKSLSCEIAKYLCNNGVIVLPCKINDTLYLQSGETARVIAFYIDGKGGMFDLEISELSENAIGVTKRVCKDYAFEDIGRSIFLEPMRKESGQAIDWTEPPKEE